MINAILFDLDGTLLNTNDLIYKSFDNTFKTVLNKTLSKEEITLLYGKPLETSLDPYSENEYVLKDLVDTYRSFNLKHHDEMCKPFDGAKELLSTLKNRGIKTGIVTSKRKDLAKRGLELGGLIDYLDVIISPEDTKKHKPEGDPAIKACEFLKVDPKETMMVGDSPYDLLCGINAGCYTCGVSYTALNIEELKNVKPDYMVENPLQILELI